MSISLLPKWDEPEYYTIDRAEKAYYMRITPGSRPTIKIEIRVTSLEFDLHTGHLSATTHHMAKGSHNSADKSDLIEIETVNWNNVCVWENKKEHLVSISPAWCECEDFSKWPFHCKHYYCAKWILRYALCRKERGLLTL